MHPQDLNSIARLSFIVGVRAAMHEHDVDYDDLALMKHASAAQAETGATGRLAARIAYGIYKLAGWEGTAGANFFGQLAESPNWSASHEEAVALVYRLVCESRGYDVPLTKEANVNPAALAAGALKGGTGLLGTALMVAATGGGGLGVLDWHLRRQAEEDDKEGEVLKAQTKFYKDLAERIQSESVLKKIPLPSR